VLRTARRAEEGSADDAALAKAQGE